MSRFFYFSTNLNDLIPHDLIQQKLNAKQQAGSYRQLKPESGLTDFCSNDYLGFARSAKLSKIIEEEIGKHQPYLIGSTGSRLLAGNTQYAEDLEHQIAAYHGSQAALLFNSGYDANLGLLSCLPQRGDTVIHDELAHASIIDGIRLSHAKRHSFKHNNLNDLEQKLKHAQGICYVVVESVYSMDGNQAPLAEIAQLIAQYNAALIVDEAHALGVFGKGLVNVLGLEEQVFARVVTFGKALGCHGAVVLGSNLLRQYLINFSRSFIYTTAAPFHQLAAIKMGYELLDQSQDMIDDLQAKVSLYNGLMYGRYTANSTSAIQTIIIGGNQQTRDTAAKIQDAGFDVRAILSPTVIEGSERLRICIHSYNTNTEIEQLVNTIKQIQNGA